jgi:hypothetical protein
LTSCLSSMSLDPLILPLSGMSSNLVWTSQELTLLALRILPWVWFALLPVQDWLLALPFLNLLSSM